ncbi:MAG: Nucleotidyltransferase domain protein [candidate division BRC1 bacterium ADurb.BinA292]|nr:MAG: Nucleotidyltransferase domain protein [candidate division BRC1 bacterium ADurb.BinA292]
MATRPTDIQKELDRRYEAALAAAAGQVAGQFDAPPEVVDAWRRAIRVVRQALAELCWPQPTWGATLRQWRGHCRIQLGDLLPHPGIDTIEGLMSAMGLGRHLRADYVEFTDLHSICRWLRKVYTALRQEQPPLKHPPDRVRLNIPGYSRNLADRWRAERRLATLPRLIRRLRKGTPRSIDPILFGSLAREEAWPRFSDVDLCLIFDDDAITATSSLTRTVRTCRQIAPLLAAADALHHHGPYVLFESDWDAYSESLLPLATLGRAMTMESRPYVQFVRVYGDRHQGLSNLAQARRGILDLLGQPDKLADRYTAKYLVSLVLLLPALVCSARGIPFDKADAFDFLKPLLNDPARQTLEAVEAIRREWRETIQPPAVLLRGCGALAGCVGRQVNRWPSRSLQQRLIKLGGGIRHLADACLELGILELV